MLNLLLCKEIQQCARKIQTNEILGSVRWIPYTNRGLIIVLAHAWAIHIWDVDCPKLRKPYSNLCPLQLLMYWQNFSQIVGLLFRLIMCVHEAGKKMKRKKTRKKLESCVIMCFTRDQNVMIGSISFREKFGPAQ